MTSGPIGYEYAIQAERSVLLAALGLEPDSIDEIVTASLRAQAESDPAGWCDEHGISYSLWEKWPWYTFEPGFRGSDD